MIKAPHIIEFRTSLGTVVTQFVTEETFLKLKELELKHIDSWNHHLEFEIEVIKLLLLDTYRVL
jgi:hypothetical protein